MNAERKGGLFNLSFPPEETENKNIDVQPGQVEFILSLAVQMRHFLNGWQTTRKWCERSMYACFCGGQRVFLISEMCHPHLTWIWTQLLPYTISHVFADHLKLIGWAGHSFFALSLEIATQKPVCWSNKKWAEYICAPKLPRADILWFFCNQERHDSSRNWFMICTWTD